MLTVLGEMESASKIFDFLFLGSEWNAANKEELDANGISHVLNVTKEIDNFFPASFNYKNVLLYDLESSDLLVRFRNEHWYNLWTYINSCLYFFKDVFNFWIKIRHTGIRHFNSFFRLGKLEEKYWSTVKWEFLDLPQLLLLFWWNLRVGRLKKLLLLWKVILKDYHKM